MENNIHIAISDCWDFRYKDGYNKLQLSFFNKYVFNNINKTLQYSILKLVFIMYNFGRLTNDNVEKMEFLILYSSNNYFICLNN